MNDELVWRAVAALCAKKGTSALTDLCYKHLLMLTSLIKALASLHPGANLAKTTGSSHHCPTGDILSINLWYLEDFYKPA